MWLFPPELQPNVTLWDSRYKALDPECEPKPLVQHYIARQRMVANSTGPTEELLAWTRKQVRAGVNRPCVRHRRGCHTIAPALVPMVYVYSAAFAYLLLSARQPSGTNEQLLTQRVVRCR